MLNLDKFIAECVTERPRSMFIDDIDANRDVLSREICGKRVLVIGGADRFLFYKSVASFHAVEACCGGS